MHIDSHVASAVIDYVMGTAPVLMLELDKQQRVVNANTHACRVLGEELERKTLRELVVNFTPVPEPLESVARQEKGHLLTLNTPNGLPETFRFKFIEVATGWILLGSLDFDEETHLRSQVMGLNRELNDLTRQLQQTNAELRELNGLKNQFLGMAAHDLRKPLNVITTYTEFVLDETEDRLGAQHREFLQTCLNAARGMKEIIDNFLDLAVIESGKLSLDLESVTVATILEGALEICRLLAARKEIALLVEAPAMDQILCVDTPKLQQVFVNLISNAVEHSRPGQRVWVSSCLKNRELLFAVRDEGHGIESRDKDRLFQPFQRANTSKSAGERRVGLGLAIARQVIEAHRGRLWVESSSGEGTTFFFVLPNSKSTENNCA